MWQWLRERENTTLLIIVIGAWIFAILLYYFLRPNPLHFQQRAESIANAISEIDTERADRNVRLVHLVISELMTTQGESFWRGVGQHAALALFVAGLLILFVDIHTRRETRREAERYRRETREEVENYTKGVAANVWKAVSGRLVPDEICKEIDGVLKCDVVKEDCNYTITIGVHCEGLEPGHLVVRRAVSYFARNLTGVEPTIYPLRARISNVLGNMTVRMEGESITLPRHVSCVIDGKEIPGEEFINPTNPRELRYDFLLPKDGGKRVYLVWDEVCKLQDGNYYTTVIPIKNLTVRVINMLPNEVEVEEIRLHHPRAADFQPTQKDLWEFKGGMLPGQAFSLSWRPRGERD